MVKKAKKSQHKSIRTSYFTVGVISLVFNAVILGALIVGCILEQTGVFNYAIVNEGANRMCSDGFRKTVEKASVTAGDSANDTKLELARVDYPCNQNNSSKYYKNGFDDYAHSLGLNP
jgi:hypothetical protein